MHEKSQADTLDIWSVVLLSQVSRLNKLSHNYLYQDPHTCRLSVSLFFLMPEFKGQKKLRLTKERLTEELIETKNSEETSPTKRRSNREIDRRRD